MTTDDRCPRCDRPQAECDRREAGIALHRASKGRRIAVGERVSDEYQAALARVISADRTCRSVDWRARAKAAEAERDAAHAALRKISDIRDSIVGMQGFNFSEHAYPLVAVLDAAGFKGAGYKIARANLGTLIEQVKAAEAEVARLGLLVKEACAVIDEAANETARNGRPISANVLRDHAADIRRHAERGVDDATDEEETADV